MFSVFAKQEEAASRCSCTLAAEENHVMVRHKEQLYSSPFFILSQGITVTMP